MSSPESAGHAELGKGTGGNLGTDPNEGSLSYKPIEKSSSISAIIVSNSSSSYNNSSKCLPANSKTVMREFCGRRREIAAGRTKVRPVRFLFISFFLVKRKLFS
jgi:hypothetical protein